MSPNAVVLCADIGATSTKFGVSNGSEPVEVLGSIPTRGPVESFADAMVESLASARLKASREGARILGVGVAVAGFLDPDRGSMIYNSNLPWLEGYALRRRLASGLE